MKIYLDIDDTLIHTDLFNMRPANYVREFLTNIVNKHDPYWLTTHCDGDASRPVFYLAKIFPEELIPIIMKIKPTTWNVNKIEAINLDEEFMWFDDILEDTEEKLLISKGKRDSHIMVNLDDNPDFLKDYLKI